MDLPPCNSFCRLLTHKLADYYHMTHSFEAVAGAVRIYRTPFCRVPPSLQSIAAANESASSTPPPAMLPRKIMRRGEEGDSAPASAGPSKPTSEDGSDAKDKNANANQKYVVLLHFLNPSILSSSHRLLTIASGLPVRNAKKPTTRPGLGSSVVRQRRRHLALVSQEK